MGFVLRDYQAFASQSVFTYYEQGNKGHPVIAMPTGTGKSVIIGDLAGRIVTTWSGQRILVLAPSKELIEQNAAKFMSMFPMVAHGVCSASLGRYELGRAVTFGTIGTIYNRRKQLGRIDMVFVDECHLVSDKDTTLYRKLFDYLLDENQHVKFVGLSATPYRLGVGHIIDGGLFTDVCCDATSFDAFNWFIDQGYLVPLIPRPTRTKLDTEGLKTQGGDYSESDQQRKFNKEAITKAVIDEARELAHDRKKILVFATGIEHCEAIRNYLESVGESAVAVHSKSETRDDDLLAFMTEGDNGVRWCINFGVLTTGFDFPGLDCIVMIRVTKSPGLWVQMLGRGTRPDWMGLPIPETAEERLALIVLSGKPNCLVLDFGHNTATLGPINDPHLPKKKGKGGGPQIVKTCKKDNTVPGTAHKNGFDAPCGVWNHPSVRHCINCGAEFLFEVKFVEQASGSALLKGAGGVEGAFEKPVVNEYQVTRMTFERHFKQWRPDSIKVMYYCGLRRFHQYLCPEHGGIPRRKGEGWWQAHGGGSMPGTTTECLPLIDTLRTPKTILVHENKKYPDIINWTFDHAAP